MHSAQATRIVLKMVVGAVRMEEGDSSLDWGAGRSAGNAAKGMFKDGESICSWWVNMKGD